MQRPKRSTIKIFGLFVRNGKRPVEASSSSLTVEEQMVTDYISEQNYHALAWFITGMGSYYSFSKKFHDASSKAANALCEAGAEAVPAIVREVELARRAWEAGVDDLVRVLLKIGDPKAVPILKFLLDDGSLDAHPMLKDETFQFVNRWPELHPPAKMVTCLYCEKTFPLSETKAYGDKADREWRLCKFCWPNRASWISKINERGNALKPYAFREIHWKNDK